MIECDECKSHYEFDMKGFHDHVNAGLKKIPQDKKLYKKWVKEVNDVHNQCKKDGRC